MKTRVTVLVAAALTVGAIAAPAADAKFCQAASTTSNKYLGPSFEQVGFDSGEAGVMFATACAATGG